jgi:tRNA1Val (adenine37-N6)-methyltransferase
MARSTSGIFRFKQFSLNQQDAPLKITTDASIFGAWVELRDEQSIVDIGTGTGLLALMVAQRSKARITALDIDLKVIELAKSNFAASPWAHRMQAVPMAIQAYAASARQSFDLIICNPPFFNAHMPQSDARKQLALHDDTLPQQELIESMLT